MRFSEVMAGKPETEPKEICLCKVLKSGSGFLIGFGGAVAACIAAEKKNYFSYLKKRRNKSISQISSDISILTCSYLKKTLKSSRVKAQISSFEIGKISQLNLGKYVYINVNNFSQILSKLKIFTITLGSLLSFFKKRTC